MTPPFSLPSVNVPNSFKENWNDWKWQMRKGFQNIEDYSQWDLRESEQKILATQDRPFKVRSTPYYNELLYQTHEQNNLRSIAIPQYQEQLPGLQQQKDPLGEKANEPTPRLLHRYSDRALLLVTDTCSVYCRYCTRKHFTATDSHMISSEDFSKALDYLKCHKGIREVLLSGGDPLTLSDSHLYDILKSLREIPHIEIIRIGTRMPVVCPMRITDDLVQLFKEFQPLFIMHHFNHPDEVTQESVEAIRTLSQGGITQFNQMVLLNGINNDPAIVQALSRRLLFFQVVPYYMFQCDPSQGTDHLRTSIDNSLAIQKELFGHLSGLALPQLSVDIPNGGGKAYYVPQFETHQSESHRNYRGWDGVESIYVNPPKDKIYKPPISPLYKEEWERVKSSKKPFLNTKGETT